MKQDQTDVDIDERIRRALLEPTAGKRLRALRKARGLSVADVLEKIDGLHRMTLSRIENDRQHRSAYQAALAELYGSTKEEVLRPDQRSLMADRTIGQRVEARRLAMDYTRDELAAAVGEGCTYQTIYGIEAQGKSSRHLNAILDVLGLSAHEEATNASALLREIRVQLMLDAGQAATISGMRVRDIEKAEEHNADVAARVIVALCRGLLDMAHDREDVQDTVQAHVVDVSDDGTFEMPDAAAPSHIRIDGQLEALTSTRPGHGDRAVVVTLEDGHYVGRMGVLMGDKRHEELRTGRRDSHPIRPRDVVHIMRVG